MNPITCTYINTFTNVVAIIPVQRYISKKDYLGATLCSCSFVSSVLMHISEKKHGLPGVFFKEYSNVFLNVDRFFAVLLAFYGAYNFLQKTNKEKKLSIKPIIAFGIGSIASFIGEKTTNLILYTILHTVWHTLSYGTLAYTI